MSYPARSVPGVLDSVVLAARDSFAVSAVTCRDDHVGWSGPELRDGHHVVLVRRGRFRRHAAGTTEDLDPTVGYIGTPGQEERFAHPAGGDVCTSVSLAPALWRSVAGDGARPTAPALYVDARLDLAHRRLLAAAGRPDVEYALAERLMDLLGEAVRRTVAGPTPAAEDPAGRPAGGDPAVVAAARAAIVADHPAARGLLPLAALLGASPYRLSRAFPRQLGVSLTHYRNRVRVGRALDRIEDGEPSLARLAADLGFADQAHLCRTVKEQLGHTPTALRRLLEPAR